MSDSNIKRWLLDSETVSGVQRCVRCSICVPNCPSYRLYKNESDSPRGRVQLIRGLIEGRIELTEDVEEHFDRCLGCRACEDVCPSGVPYARLLDRVRAAARSSPHHRVRKRAVAVGLQLGVASKQGRRGAGALARMLGRLGPVRSALESYVGFMAGPLASLPAMASAPFVADRVDSDSNAEFVFFSGCIMSTALGDVQRASYRALRRRGSVSACPQQECCGALHLHAGLIDEARDLARKNIDALAREPRSRVCSNSAGCTLALKEYGELLADDRKYADAAAELSARVVDFIQVIAERPINPTRTPAQRNIGVFEACHHWNVNNVRGLTQDALRAAGIACVTIERVTGCCGSGGLFSVLQPEAGQELRSQLLDDIAASGCDTLVTSNPGCLMFVKAGAQERGMDLEVMHLAELVAELEE